VRGHAFEVRGLRLLVQRLDREGMQPLEQEPAVALVRRARAAGRRTCRQHALQPVHALCKTRCDLGAGPRLPGGREVGRLGHRADDARHLGQRVGERDERARRGRPRQHEPERGRAQRRADDCAAMLDEPELVLAIERRLVAQRPGEPEDQVVPRLVGEQQRPGSPEPVRRVRSLDDLHERSLLCIGNA
jgi:hypothetical protein